MSHGLKTLIVFGNQKRLYVKVPLHWKVPLQPERISKKGGGETNHTQLSFWVSVTQAFIISLEYAK